MVYKLKFDTGQVVSFQNEPTNEDIEEVVRKLGIKPKSASVPKDSVQPNEQGMLQKIARTLAPKSVEGFGETLGTALSTFGLKKQEEQETSEDTDLQNQVMDKLRDPNISREQKQRLFDVAQRMGVSTIGEVEAVQKTTKEIAGEALGTLGTVALGAKPSTSLVKRLGFATAFGAGAGTKKGLEQDKEAVGIIKDTVKGGAIGLATGLFFEGLFLGIKKVAPLLGKNTYNKELQPDVNELAVAFKRNADTFGSKVRNLTDASGKPVYQGTYKTMLQQAKNEVSTNGNKLETLLKQADKADDYVVNKNQVAGDIIKKLQDQYGTLTKNQLKTVQMFVNKMPRQMSRVEMLKNKRLYDGLMSKTDWNKIMLGDTQASFAGQVKYILRDNLKNAIQNSTDDAVVKGLNQRMGLGMEVRDLVARQLADRAKMKVKSQGINPISRLISRIWDDVLFNPAFTTRGSQITKSLGEITPGLGTQAAEIGIIEGLQ